MSIESEEFVSRFDEAISNEDFDAASRLLIDNFEFDDAYLDFFATMLKHVFLIGSMKGIKELANGRDDG